MIDVEIFFNDQDVSVNNSRVMEEIIEILDVDNNDSEKGRRKRKIFFSIIFFLY